MPQEAKLIKTKPTRRKAGFRQALAAAEKLAQARSMVATTEAAVAAMELQVCATYGAKCSLDPTACAPPIPTPRLIP